MIAWIIALILVQIAYTQNDGDMRNNGDNL